MIQQKMNGNTDGFIHGILLLRTALIHDLTAFQRDLLYVIAGLNEDPHGLAIKDELEESYDVEINHGRLYPNLDTLVKKGTIDRRTNSYPLTDRARREMEARREWEEQSLQNEPLTKSPSNKGPEGFFTPAAPRSHSPDIPQTQLFRRGIGYLYLRSYWIDDPGLNSELFR